MDKYVLILYNIGHEWTFIACPDCGHVGHEWTFIACPDSGPVACLLRDIMPPMTSMTPGGFPMDKLVI